MDAIDFFCAHVVERAARDFPDTAVDAAKTFILDTLGVGILGSNGPQAAEIAAVQDLSGQGHDARVWSTGKRLPAPAAALCNAYQTHNSEFDCVHEAAVAHVMTAVLPVALAGAERIGGVSGARLIEAVVLGVDVAASLGVAASSGLRFFRPGTVGAFGGVAALGKLMGFDAERLRHAFSIVYGQVGGTMQAHTEGSMLLALQMGFNARNAVVACDLAAAGIEGPRNILEGPFGYFRLIEAGGDPARVAQDLGRLWRIAEVAHKPYPSGRATHGVVDACLELRQRHAIAPDTIDQVVARVPPLIVHLVGRPPQENMAINYARLCARYVAARVLIGGAVRIEDFTDAAYRDAPTQDLAARIALEVRDVGNPNALTPVEVEIRLRDGTRHTTHVELVTGSPARALSRAAHLAKFRRNCELAARPLPPAQMERLIALVDALETVPDVTRLVDAAVA